MTTPLLRWRKVAPENLRGALQAYETGNVSEYGLTGGLIRIEYLGRHENGGWRAVQRESPDHKFDDGWWWSVVLVPEHADRPGGHLRELHEGTEATVKAVVREWWHRIEPYARELIADGLREQAAPAGAPAAAEDAVAVERHRQAADATERVTSDVAAILSENYVDLVAGVAERLRRAADRIERIGAPGQSLRDLKPDHSAAAGHVLDEITGTVGNLGLSRLIQAARDADNAARGQL